MVGTYETTVLSGFVIVVVSPGNFATPKAILTELIRMTLLTSVSETGKIFLVTGIAHDRMSHWKRSRLT